MRKIFFLFLFLTSSILSSTGDGKNEITTTLRVGINTFPASLNPVYVTDETSQAVVNKSFNSLFYFDCRGKIKKGLAAGYFLKNKGKEIILELKKNIFFSNRKELHADDVVGTIRLLKDKQYKYPYAANISFIKEVNRIDKYQLSIKLKERLAAWKNYLTFLILNSEEIKNTEVEKFRNTILSGTGYYKIKEIKAPEKITLELKNPRENPLLHRYIEYKIVKNTQLAPLKLMNEEIDICELQPENILAYKNIKSWQKKFAVLNYKKFGYTYLVFNLKKTNIDKNTRKFFYNVLIHGDFIDRFLAGRGEKVKTPFLPLNKKMSPEKLKINNMKESISLKILTNSESKLRKDFVLFLRSELKPYHIYLEPLFLEYHTFLQYLKNSRFDIAVSAFLIEMDYDMKDIFYSNSNFNYANFSNSQMDLVLDQGLRELNTEKREKIYMAAHEIWLQELPLIPLFNLYYYMGISKKIKVPTETYNVVGSTGDFLFNIEKWMRHQD